MHLVKIIYALETHKHEPVYPHPWGELQSTAVKCLISKINFKIHIGHMAFLCSYT